VDLCVTRRAQSDQVFFRIVSEQATGLNVMNLQVVHAAALLAAPPVPLEYLFPQLVVRDGIQP